jgi:hypothetical protein
MAQTDLVCSKCVRRQTVNNIMMKVNSNVMVTAVPPDQPLAYTRWPIFVSASVHRETFLFLFYLLTLKYNSLLLTKKENVHLQ